MELHSTFRVQCSLSQTACGKSAKCGVAVTNHSCANFNIWHRLLSPPSAFSRAGRRLPLLALMAKLLLPPSPPMMCGTARLAPLKSSASNVDVCRSRGESPALWKILLRLPLNCVPIFYHRAPSTAPPTRARTLSAALTLWGIFPEVCCQMVLEMGKVILAQVAGRVNEGVASAMSWILG